MAERSKLPTLTIRFPQSSNDQNAFSKKLFELKKAIALTRNEQDGPKGRLVISLKNKNSEVDIELPYNTICFSDKLKNRIMAIDPQIAINA
jgi:hypothetical protein